MRNSTVAAAVLGGFEEPGGGVCDGGDLRRSTPGAGDSSMTFWCRPHGAVALPEVDGVSVPVAEALDLDVSGVLEELLDEDGAVSEGGLCLLLRGADGGAEGGLVPADAHASAPAACGGLDDDGVSDFVGDGGGLVLILDGAVGAREDGDLGGASGGLGGDLVSESSHGLW